MRRQFKLTYTEFCENTSIHGFKRTIGEKYNKFSKFLWILIVITSFVSAAYISVLMWFKFMSNPTLTTIKTLYAPISDIAFPAVTICPNSSIVPHKLDSFVASLDLDGINVTAGQIKKSIHVLLVLLSDTYSPFATMETGWLKQVLEKNGYSEMDVFKKLTTSCEETLLKCKLEEKVVACRTIFREVFTEAGRCCAFNSFLSTHRIHYTKHFGVYLGLKVVVNSSLVNYAKTYRSLGINVLLHHFHEFPSTRNIYRKVSTGSIEYFQVRATEMIDEEGVRSISVKDRECVYVDEFKISYNLSYSDENCQHACSIREFQRYCKCVPYNYIFSGFKTCTLDDIKCISKTVNLMKMQNTDCNCPYQCEYIQYKVLSTGSDLAHTEYSTSTLLDGYNLSEVSVAVIYFSSDTYIILKRRVKSTGLQLMSTLGGTFGLFLGFSFTSGIEIVYCMLIRFVINLKVLSKTTDKPQKQVKFKESTSQKKNWDDLRLQTIYDYDGYYN